jgi:hypothetical protein
MFNSIKGKSENITMQIKKLNREPTMTIHNEGHMVKAMIITMAWSSLTGPWKENEVAGFVVLSQ